MAFEPCYLLAFGPYYLGLNCIRICRLSIGKDKCVLKFFFFFWIGPKNAGLKLNVGKNNFGLKFFFLIGPKNAGLM